MTGSWPIGFVFFVSRDDGFHQPPDLRRWPADGPRFVAVDGPAWPEAVTSGWPCALPGGGPHPAGSDPCTMGCGVEVMARPEDLVAARPRTLAETNPMAYAFLSIEQRDTRLPGIATGIYAVVRLQEPVVDGGDGRLWASAAMVVGAVEWWKDAARITTDPDILAAHFTERDRHSRFLIFDMWDEAPGVGDPAEVVVAHLHRLAAQVVERAPRDPAVVAARRARIAEIQEGSAWRRAEAARMNAEAEARLMGQGG